MSILSLGLLLPKFKPLARITKNIVDAKISLDADQLVAIPTETVYGLAAKGTSPIALKKIFVAKGRPANNPLILHFKDFESIRPFVRSLNDEVKLLADEFWPGPLTLLLPKSDAVPGIVTAGSERVAVRVPNHQKTLGLLRSLDYPLAAPSANPSGYISPTLPKHVEKQLGNKIGLILDGGACQSGIESTILGWEDNIPVIYRKGVITAEQIGAILKTIPRFNEKTKVLEAPGMLSSHYAPNTTTLVVDDVKTSLRLFHNKKVGLLLFKENHDVSVEEKMVLSASGTLEEMAQNLYAEMHRLDLLGLDIIMIEKAPEIGIGKAINDRLQRSATKE